MSGAVIELCDHQFDNDVWKGIVMADEVELPRAKDLEPEITDESFMRFGKHKGKKLKDVPDQYLWWLYSETDLHKTDGPLYDYCEDRLEGYYPDDLPHDFEDIF
jgi:hypothetical protein